MDEHTYIKDKITIAALALVSLGLLLLVVLALVHVGPDLAEAIKTAINAFLITGVIAFIFEYTLHTRFAQLYEEKVDNLYVKMKTDLPREKGIRMVEESQSRYDGYRTWATVEGKRQNLFFSGRSGLSLLDQELQRFFNRRMEDVLLEKLNDGSRIKILFLDPRSDLPKRLAKEERQSLRKMLGNIAISLGIVERIRTKMKRQDFTNQDARLHIGVYDKIAHFSYHKDDEKMIIGFYLATDIGFHTAAFEIYDDEIAGQFTSYVGHLYNQSLDSFLVRCPAYPCFNKDLFEALRDDLINQIDPDTGQRVFEAGEVDKLMSVDYNEVKLQQ